MAQLRILVGPKKNTCLLLQGNQVILGREKINPDDIRIDAEILGQLGAGKNKTLVSRKHMVITRENGSYWILNGDGATRPSTNGLKVNDKPVPFPGRIRLRRNDRITVADIELFRFEGDPEAPVKSNDSDSDFTVVKSIDLDGSWSQQQVQPAEKLRVFLEFGKILSRTLEIESLFPQLFERLYHLFIRAVGGALIQWDEENDQLTWDTFKNPKSRETLEYRFSESLVRQCIQKPTAKLGHDQPGSLPGTESIIYLKDRYWMVAPICSPEGRVLGAIYLITANLKCSFEEDDLELLTGIANQVGIALSNSLLYRDNLNHQRRQQELELAQIVHRSLLPQGEPKVKGYEFCTYFHPAREVGGDYYDYIALENGRLAILVGDVAGHSVAAALIMVKFSVEARVILEREADLATAITLLNRRMASTALDDRFVTLVALVLDPATHSMVLVNAGHLSPQLVHVSDGSVEDAIPRGASGPPIRILDDYTFQNHQIQLQPGDQLFLYTDGITEAMDRQMKLFLVQGVKKFLQHRRGSLRDTCEQLLAAVKNHSSGCEQSDDILLLGMARTDSVG